MAARVWRRIMDALVARQTISLEIYLAVQSITWGLWLLAPWHAFDVIPDAYTVLGLIPEPVWGALFFGNGVAHLVVVLKRRPTLCMRAALMLAVLWSTVLVSLLLTIPLAPSIPIYALSAAASALVYMRLHWRFS